MLDLGKAQEKGENMFKVMLIALIASLIFIWAVPTLLIVLPPWRASNSLPDWVDTPFFQAEKVIGYPAALACFELKFGWEMYSIRAGLAAAYLVLFVPVWPMIFLARKRSRTLKTAIVAVVAFTVGWILFFTRIISY